MRSIKFKKTFVFRVALASVLSLLMSLSSLVYTERNLNNLETRLQVLETSQQMSGLGSLDLKLELFEPTVSTTPTAEDELRAVQSVTPQMSQCDNQECWDL
jgi:hypothetical protein